MSFVDAECLYRCIPVEDAFRVFLKPPPVLRPVPDKDGYLPKSLPVVWFTPNTYGESKFGDVQFSFPTAALINSALSRVDTGPGEVFLVGAALGTSLSGTERLRKVGGRWSADGTRFVRVAVPQMVDVALATSVEAVAMEGRDDHLESAMKLVALAALLPSPLLARLLPRRSLWFAYDMLVRRIESSVGGTHSGRVSPGALLRAIWKDEYGHAAAIVRALGASNPRAWLTSVYEDVWGAGALRSEVDLNV